MRFVLGLFLLVSSLTLGATPLHDAARDGDGNRVRSQLAAGARINAPDDYGFTPLLLAQINGHPRTAQLLRDNGARDGLKPLVERLQRYLRYLGHDPGSIDGDLGPGTRTAIRDYQRRIGQPVNGRVREAWVKTLHDQAHRRLQEQLQQLGHYDGPIDGLIGPGTREAIRAFQRQAGLAITGEPNGDWMMHLRTAVSRPAETATPAPVADEAAQPTTETARIRRLQAGLTVLGHDTGGVDGVIGPATRSAIRGFQRQHGLSVDGNPSATLYHRVDRALTRHVQQHLRALGFDPGSVDGVPGENTRIAIQSFERQQGLPVTGRVSPTLAARLETAQRNQEPAEPITLLTHQREIRAAQRYLRTLGLETGPVDGEMGPATRDALRRYQNQRGLPETGRLTDRLLARLASDATSSDSPAEPTAQTRFIPALITDNPGQPINGGNTEIRGALVLQHADGGELLGCSISGIQLDRSWCEPFEHHPDTSDCQAVLRPDTRVLMVKCS